MHMRIDYYFILILA